MMHVYTCRLLCLCVRVGHLDELVNHHPSSQGWAPGHFVFACLYSLGSRFSFFSSFATDFASVLNTCIFTHGADLLPHNRIHNVPEQYIRTVYI